HVSVMTNRLAAGIRPATSAKRGPDRTERFWSDQQRAVFIVDGVLCIDGLHNMVWTDRDVRIGRRKAVAAYSAKNSARKCSYHWLRIVLPRVVVCILVVRIIADRQRPMTMFGGRIPPFKVRNVCHAGRDSEGRRFRYR